VRRYLDYGKRVRSGQGMEELYQWVGKILLDDGQVYSLEDQARAFEIGAVERLADLWTELQGGAAEQVVVSGQVDKVFLYRQILSLDPALEQRAAFFQILVSRYKKHGTWIRECVAAREDPASYQISGCVRLFEEFLAKLEKVERLPGVVGEERRRLELELERLQEEHRQRQKEVAELEKDLEFAEDRARRAHQRLRELEEEVKQLRKQLRVEGESGKKLRTERRNRIRSERQSSETRRELETLQREYVKLDRRLQEMARRLAQAEAQRLAGRPGTRVDLSGLRQLGMEQLLGVEGRPAEEELGEIRRRFAAVFHPDRVGKLPAWAKVLCDEVLVLVNEVCDQARK